ncbi:DNA-directed RNA polymerase sigma-70 factor [Fulvitalea axinellae]|uniref:DNA-directed RNA polymerase sigma-70 factor n=1 Tax=Fulvitalea axinellae TaxID=1182444 RepID=A0AAU9CEY8_9BACT|nr:DNA-directed RNA polymerase sigma-70 factor [Fulvitalea axinellae]
MNSRNLNEFVFNAFQSGDERAFEYIFDAYYGQVVGFCAQFVYDDAESVAQDTFVRLWASRSKVEKPQGIRSFLFTIARSECLNVLRRKTVASKYQDHLLWEKEASLNRETLKSFDFNSVEFAELEDLFMKAVETLPERCRQVFVMSRMEGMKNREIAEELGLTTKAVEANITRALKHMREHLSDYVMVLVLMAAHYK